MIAGADRAASSRPADPARLAAARILFDVLEKGAFANLSSIQRLDDSRLDQTGRRFASALIYGTLGRIFSIDWLLAKVSERDVAALDPWVRTILRLGAWQLYWSASVPAPSAIDESVRLAHRLARPAAGYVNAALRRLHDSRPELPRNNPPVYYSLPPELYGYLRKACDPDEVAALAESFLREDVRVTARINPLKTTAEALIEELAGVGVQAMPGRYCPEALSLDLHGQPVRGLPAWQEGRLSIQDEAAMLVGHASDPSSDILIIDLCAAPGGKTCHLAELTAGHSQILACDIHVARLRLIEQNAQRLGLANIRCVLHDAAAGLPEDAVLKAASADLVLADVPCSGLGLLARKPEIRLTMTHDRIVAMYPLQAAILRSAANLVKPGGSLIYSTCTINPAENIGRIREFLAEAAGLFTLDPLTARLPAPLLSFPDLRETAAEGWIQLLPHRHGVDGFFIARLRRQP